MLAQPLVSVILPTHNRAQLLGRAIGSVLGQSYRDLELVVVDDASTDETPDVVKRFDDPRLRYLRLERNSRAAAARNAGIRVANGEWLSFQDDDDEWLPQKLERQVAALAKAPADVGLLLCSFRRVEKDIVWHVGGEGYFRQLDFDRYFRDRDYSLISTPNWLLRKSVLDRTGLFDERLRSLDDWELGLRIFKACRVQHLDEELWIQYQLRAADAGMATNPRLILQDYVVLLDKHGASWSGRTVSRYSFQVARVHAMEGRWAQARPWLRRALRSDPLNWKACALLVASFAGARATRIAVSGWGKLWGARRRLVGAVYEDPTYRGRYESRREQP